MKFTRQLALHNLRRRPVRTAALILLSGLLTMSVFGGSVVISSLRRGLSSYEARLGADIVAVPYQARTRGTFESILLQGIPGTFYMDEAYYNKICTIDGVEQAAPEFYLASASAGCCSAAVQIIGFDPGRDFTIQPWIRESYGSSLGDGDIIVGSELVVPKSGVLTFYNTDCRVVAQLDRTGTGLDTAVYANMNTIREMIVNAKALGFHTFDKIDPDHAVSSVMIRVADGYDPELVAGDINIYVRHVAAASAASMFSGIARGLSDTSAIVGILMALVWVLAAVILVIAFAMIIHERTKELAVLRVIGASRSMLSGLLITEALAVSFAGGVTGLLLASLIVFPFSTAISSRLGLPYLMPDTAQILLMALLSLVIALIAGASASAFSAARTAGSEAGLLLREDA